jgi:hypothetical protein
VEVDLIRKLDMAFHLQRIAGIHTGEIRARHQNGSTLITTNLPFAHSTPANDTGSLQTGNFGCFSRRK